MISVSQPQPRTGRVLTGQLRLVRRRHLPPRLELLVWCSACRESHVHSWGFDPLIRDADEYPATATPRHAHCGPCSPWFGRVYYVRPERTAKNRAVLRRFRRSASPAELPA